MQNVNYTLRGRKLVIEVDLAAPGTSTGRGNEMVATTGNWAQLPEIGKGWSMNFVLVKKPGARVPDSVVLDANDHLPYVGRV